MKATTRRRRAVTVAALAAALMVATALSSVATEEASADTGPGAAAAFDAHVDMVRRILEVGGHQPGEDPLDRAVLLAHAVTGAAPPAAPGAPATPSAAAGVLLERHGVVPNPDQAAALAALDAQPAPVPAALARVLNATVSFEVARERAFAGLDQTVLDAWRAAIDDGLGAPPGLPLLEEAGARFELIDAAHAEMVDAGVALARAAESSELNEPTMATASAPPDLEVPLVLAIDTDRFQDNTYSWTFMTIDLGGNDTYAGNIVAVDVGGHDRYSTDLTAFLLDTSGNDYYAGGPRFSNGGGETEIVWPGTGFLLDGGGGDVYTAGALGATNGGGVLGRGALIDSAGKDFYSATGSGRPVWARATNGTGVAGHGLLLDGGGHEDRYDEGRYCSTEGPLGELCPDGSGFDRTRFVKGPFGSQLDLVPNTSGMVADLSRYLEDLKQYPWRAAVEQAVNDMCRVTPATIDGETRFTVGWLLEQANFWVMILEQEIGQDLSDPVEDPVTNTEAWRTLINTMESRCGPPPPSGPSVSVNNVSVAEGGAGITTTADFTVSLSAPSSAPVSVNYATANGTALAGSDYTAASGTLSFAAGEVTKTLPVSVAGDGAPEPDETLFVDLSVPSGGSIGDGRGQGTIRNDDNALSVSDVTLTEGATGTVAVFSVTLAPANPNATVTVDYATADGTATAGDGDYVPTSGSLVFTGGSTQRPVAVPVRGDTRDEPNETFVLRLFGPANAVLGDGEGQAAIVDDDAPPVVGLSVNDVVVTEGNMVGPVATFTVRLSGVVTDQAVSVDYLTSNGTATAPRDYNPAAGTLVFKPYTTALSVSVPVNSDLVDEANETFFVDLVNASANAFLADPQGVGTIVDDDNPPSVSISIDDVAVSEGHSGVKLMSFPVRLTGPSATVVTVDFATADGSASLVDDYVPAAGTVVFNPGVTTRTITVEVHGDTAPESDEFFVVNLSNATNALIYDNQAVGTITNDDF